MTRLIGGWSVAAILAAVVVGVLAFGWWDRATMRAEDRGRAADVRRARVVIERLEREAAVLEARVRAADSARAVRPMVRVVRDPVRVPDVPRETPTRDSVVTVEVDGVPWPVPVAVARAVERLVAELEVADSLAASAARVVAIVDTVRVEVPVAMAPEKPRGFWRRAVAAVSSASCAGVGGGLAALDCSRAASKRTRFSSMP
jgi:hypothetical protein